MTRKILIALDLDHTTIPWLPRRGNESHERFDEEAFSETVRFFRSAEVRENVFLLFTTGRGVSAFHEVRPLLEEFPVDAVSLNNGKQLFVRPEELHHASWMERISADLQDDAWQSFLIEEHGWDHGPATELFASVLQDEGFVRALKGNPFYVDGGVSHILYRRINDEPNAGREERHWLASMTPDETCFSVTPSHPSALPSVLDYTAGIAGRMRDAFSSRGIRFAHCLDTSFLDKEGRVCVFFGPEGVMKQSSLEFLVSRVGEGLAGIITAGDGLNDLELLSASAYGSVRNLPLVVGTSADLYARVIDSGGLNVLQVETAALSKGLRAQWDRFHGAPLP